MRLNEIKTGDISRIKNLCVIYGVFSYNINEDLSISVDGDLKLTGDQFEELPFTLREVKGNLLISNCHELKSLKGFPKKVGKTFMLSGLQGLETLEGCPDDVGNFTIIDCPLIDSFKLGPKKVRGYYHISDCDGFTNLEGLPTALASYLMVNKCKNFTSLKGCPTSVGGFVDIDNSKNLESLDHLPKFIGELLSIGEINPKIKNLLVVFKIKGLNRVHFTNDEVARILTKHLLSPERDMIECQEELIEAGFKEYARLK